MTLTNCKVIIIFRSYTFDMKGAKKRPKDNKMQTEGNKIEK